ncbi:MAG: ferrochelatase [Owenweeksia sp.]|nr:ferrochelatase [Owenweeksia sp.]
MSAVAYESEEAFSKDRGIIDIWRNPLHLALEKEYDHVLFSYHGIPERHVRKSDITKSHCLKVADCCQQKYSPAHEYRHRHQVFETTEEVVQRLRIPREKYGSSFQSRLGRDPWLTPFTDKTIVEFAQRGVKKLVVICARFCFRLFGNH